VGEALHAALSASPVNCFATQHPHTPLPCANRLVQTLARLSPVCSSSSTSSGSSSSGSGSGGLETPGTATTSRRLSSTSDPSHEHQPAESTAAEASATSTSSTSSPPSQHPHSGSVDKREIAKFAALADRWWDQSSGPFAPLHALNAARCLFIRRALAASLGLGAQAAGGEPLAGLKVLDVGCGGGLLSEPLARMGARVTGIDLSDESVGAAAAHAAADPLIASRVRYRRAPAEALAASETERGGFDVVIASEVIEHVRAPGEFVKTLAALARPGGRGRVIISTLNRTPQAYALAIVGAEYLTGLVPRGTHHWSKFITPQELGMMAADAGLELEQVAGMVMGVGGAGRFGLSDDVGVNYIALLRGGGGGVEGEDD